MISIVIVSFPADEKYLKRAFASCLLQDTEYEISFVYAGDPNTLSKETLGVLQANEHYTIEYLSDDPGHGACRNVAVANSKGDSIIFLDSDDYLLPNALQYMQYAMQELNVDVVFGKMEDGFFFECSPPGRNGVNKELILQTNPIFTTSLFTREMWNKAGGIDPSILYDDYNLFAKMFVVGAKFKYIGIPIYHHKTRPDSITNRNAEDVERHNREAIAFML